VSVEVIREGPQRTPVILHRWRAGSLRFHVTSEGVVEMWKHGAWQRHYINDLCPQIVRELTQLARVAGAP
jgi:6-phosphogluconate dehydrogenase (decarboxylating)